MTRDKIVCVRLTLEEYMRAQGAAEAYGYTLSALIRYLLCRFVDGMTMVEEV